MLLAVSLWYRPPHSPFIRGSSSHLISFLPSSSSFREDDVSGISEGEKKKPRQNSSDLFRTAEEIMVLLEIKLLLGPDRRACGPSTEPALHVARERDSQGSRR